MSHRHYVAEAECVEIDAAVCLSPVAHAGHLGGFIFAHDRVGHEVRCEGMVRVCECVPRPRWTLTGSLAAGDLTLHPSILCRLGSVDAEECGFHGWVRAGRWIPA